MTSTDPQLGPGPIDLAQALRAMLAGLELSPQDERDASRVATATDLRNLGFDAVAAYDLADRMAASLVEFAERCIAVRESAASVIGLAEEIEAKVQTIERRKW